MTFPHLPSIPPAEDDALQQRLRRRFDGKTKPLGALGRLESLASQIGLVQGTETPYLLSPQLLVFAADHGLTAQGVSAYPSEVTWQMVENFLAGGAAVSVLARQHELELSVVDAGVRHVFVPRPGLIDRKQGPGTQDALLQPAMSAAQCAASVRAGQELVQQLPGNVLLLGEMGIGNSSSAAMLLSRLTGAALSDCVGRGTGLDDDGLARKLDVLSRVLARHAAATSPWDMMAAFGGFELAMLAGAACQAAAERRLIVVDGFIASAAVLWAASLAPALPDYCIWSHCSAEPGHRLLMQSMGAEPLLELGMRLGEGSGAALAWPLIDSAVRLLRDMASFESAGVSERAKRP